jgi:hypothetical protein
VALLRQLLVPKTRNVTRGQEREDISFNNVSVFLSKIALPELKREKD